MKWQHAGIFAFLFTVVIFCPSLAYTQGPLETGIYAIQTPDGHIMGALDGGNHAQDAFFTTQTYIGPWERFRFIALGNGYYAWQTYDGHFVGALDGGNHTQDALFSTQIYIGPWEQFRLIDLGNGYFAIQTSDGQHFIGALDGGNHAQDALFTTQTYAGPWEQFRFIPIPSAEFLAPGDPQVITAIGDKVTEYNLGVPSEETPAPRPTPGKIGYYQHFLSGYSVYWSPNTGAHVVLGAIRGKWLSVGAEQSFLGFPLTDELATSDTIGRYNHFEGGSIHWTPCDGAWDIYGAIREYWAAHGWETGHLGYPVSDEEDDVNSAGQPTGNRISRFQYGTIKFNGTQGAWEENEVQLKVGNRTGGGERYLANGVG